MPRFVVCVPAEGVPSQPPCEDVDGVAHIQAVVVQPAPGEVHFGNAQTLFAYGFVIVLTFFFVGSAVGAILSVIRR